MDDDRHTTAHEGFDDEGGKDRDKAGKTDEKWDRIIHVPCFKNPLHLNLAKLGQVYTLTEFAAGSTAGIEGSSIVEHLLGILEHSMHVRSQSWVNELRLRYRMTR
jgi:hypothetical protein